MFAPKSVASIYGYYQTCTQNDYEKAVTTLCSHITSRKEYALRSSETAQNQP
jgi:hypothetical protein